MKSQTFGDSDYYSLVDRLEAVLEIITNGGNDIVAVTITAIQDKFLAAIFYKAKS